MPDYTDWISVLNTTNEIIPSGALMAPLDVDAFGNLKVGKPTANGQFCVVNGEVVIQPFAAPDAGWPNTGSAGSLGLGTYDPRVVMAYDLTESPPVATETWGAQAGSWFAGRGQTGFQILGAPGMGLVNAVRASSTPSTPAVFFLNTGALGGWTFGPPDINGWSNVLFSISVPLNVMLPSPGAYAIFAYLVASGTADRSHAGGTFTSISYVARIKDELTAVALPGTDLSVIFNQAYTNSTGNVNSLPDDQRFVIGMNGSCFMFAPIRVSTSTRVFTVQVSNASPAFSAVMTPSGARGSIGYIRLGD